MIGLRATPIVVEKNKVFKSVNGSEIVGDVFLPESPGLKRSVVMVHGGGWMRRSGDMSGIARHLAREGFLVFNITYRLAPAARYPKQVEDVQDAVKWLKKNADHYSLDVNKISGWGYSAGANLILLAAIDGKLGLNAIVAGGTPADLTKFGGSPLVRAFLGKSLKEAPELWHSASPVNHVTKSSPPVFLYHGKWDWIVHPEQSKLMAKALRAKNRPVEIYDIPFMGHIDTYLFNTESIRRGIEFLRAQN